jgi:hypothetical protein
MKPMRDRVIDLQQPGLAKNRMNCQHGCEDITPTENQSSPTDELRHEEPRKRNYRASGSIGRGFVLASRVFAPLLLLQNPRRYASFAPPAQRGIFDAISKHSSPPTPKLRARQCPVSLVRQRHSEVGEKRKTIHRDQASRGKKEGDRGGNPRPARNLFRLRMINKLQNAISEMLTERINHDGKIKCQLDQLRYSLRLPECVW